MKKFFALAVFFVVTGFAPLFALPPVLFYSDLVSGPKTGGKNNNGVFVTVSGKNFGVVKGQGYVSIGGGKAADYPAWSDGAISFQLGAGAQSGKITVTTPEGTSNGLDFTVRDGRIFFVDANSPASPGSGSFSDPWRSPASYYQAMRAGDTCYFRGGTYSGRYAESGANFNFGSAAAQGQLNNEIAFVGYPGETARFEASGSISTNFLFGYAKNYYVIAGLQMYGYGKCLWLEGGHIRIIGNSMEGLKYHTYGIIHPVIGSDFKIYGNKLFGARSGSKLDHPIYVGYGSDNVDIGWNHFYDNDVAEGPMISINTDYAITSHYKFENIRIHDNIMDMRKSSVPMRGIGIVATDRGSSVYIYNNVFIGEGNSSAVYQYSANSYIYNNTFYNPSASSSLYFARVIDGANDYRPETVEVRNNIFNFSGGNYLSVSDEAAMTAVSIDHNCYFGGGAAPARDTAAVNLSPLFANASGYNLSLSNNSPCIDKGVLSALVVTDILGTARPQGAAPDIGAHEYASGAPAVVITTSTPSSSTATSSTGTVTALDGDVATVPDTPITAEDGTVIEVDGLRVIGAAAGRGTVNPDRGESAKIYYRGDSDGRFELRIFTLAGELAWEDAQTGAREGMFEWKPSGMGSGIYTAHVKGPGVNMRKKIAVLR